MAYLTKDDKNTFKGFEFYVFEGCFRDSVVSLIQYGGGKISETLSQNTIKIARQFIDVPDDMKQLQILAIDFITDCLVKGCMIHPYGYILCSDYKYTPTFAPNFRKLYAKFEAEGPEQSQPVGESDDTAKSGPVVKPGVSRKPSNLQKVNEINDSYVKLNTSKNQQGSRSGDSEDKPKVSQKTGNFQVVISPTISDSDEEVDTSSQQDDTDEDHEKESQVSYKTRKGSKLKVGVISDSDEEVNTSKQNESEVEENEEECEVFKKPRIMQIIDSYKEVDTSRQQDDTDEDHEKESQVSYKTRKGSKLKVGVISDSDKEVNTSKQNESEVEENEEECEVFKKPRIMQIIDSYKEVDTSSQQDDTDEDHEKESQVSYKTRKGSKLKMDVISDSDKEVNTSKQNESEVEENEEECEVFKKPRIMQIIDSYKEVDKSKQGDKDDDNEEVPELSNKTRKGTNKKVDTSNDSYEEVNISWQTASEVEENDEEPEVFKKTSNVQIIDSYKEVDKSKQDDKDDDIEEVPELSNKTRKGTNKKVDTSNDSYEEVNISWQTASEVEENEEEPEVFKKTSNVQIIDSYKEVDKSKQDDKDDDIEEVPELSNKTRKGTNKKVDTSNDSYEQVNISLQTEPEVEDIEEEPEISKKTINLQKINTVYDYYVEVSTSEQADDEDDSEEEPKFSNKTRKDAKEKVDTIHDSVEEVSKPEQQYSECEHADEVLKVANQSVKNKVGTVKPEDSVEKSSTTSKSTWQDSEVEEHEDEPEVSTKRTRNLKKSKQSTNDLCTNEPTHSRWLNTKSTPIITSSIRPETNKLSDSVELSDSKEECEESKKPSVDLFQAFRNRRKKRNLSKKKSRAVEVTESKDEFRQEAKEASKSMIPAKKAPRRFSVKEENAIMTYIRENKLHTKVKGSLMWQQMEKKKVVQGRSWQSLREHFKKQIFPKIDSFEKVLGKEEIQLYKQGPARKAPRRFSVKEENAIMTYIRENKLHTQVKGSLMWKKMEKKKVVQCRSWQSLHEHFKKQILPKIDSFEKVLCKEEIQLYKQIWKNRRCKSKSKIMSLEFLNPKHTLQEKYTITTVSRGKKRHGTKIKTAIDKDASSPESTYVTRAAIIKSSSKVVQNKSSMTNSKAVSTRSSKKDAGGSKSKSKDVEVSHPKRSGRTNKSLFRSPILEESQNMSPGVSVPPRRKFRRILQMSSSSSASVSSDYLEKFQGSSSSSPIFFKKPRYYQVRKNANTNQDDVPLIKRLCASSSVSKSPLVKSHVSVRPMRKDTINGNTTIAEQVRKSSRTGQFTNKSPIRKMRRKKNQGKSRRDSKAKVKNSKSLWQSQKDSSKKCYKEEPNEELCKALSPVIKSMEDSKNGIFDGIENEMESVFCDIESTNDSCRKPGEKQHGHTVKSNDTNGRYRMPGVEPLVVVEKEKKISAKKNVKRCKAIGTCSKDVKAVPDLLTHSNDTLVGAPFRVDKSLQGMKCLRASKEPKLSLKINYLPPQPDEFESDASATNIAERALQRNDNIGVVKISDFSVTFRSLKEPLLEPTIASDKDLVCALCPSCKNFTLYSQLNPRRVGSNRPGRCPRCAQKGFGIEMKFSFRLVLEVGFNYRCHEVNILGDSAQQLLGCTENEFLEDQDLRRQVLDTLASAVLTKATIQGTIVCTTRTDCLSIFMTHPKLLK